MTMPSLPLLLVLVVASPGGNSDKPSVACRATVPPGISATEKSPNGETNAVRYTTAYEAFWWNCVLLKAGDIAARCPFVCSGNAAASLGCANGGVDASSDIDALSQRFPKEQVREYLRDLAQSPVSRAKIKPYFGSTPRAEGARE
jgi:hypothetical protein